MGSRLGGMKSAAKKFGISLEEWQQKHADGFLRCYCCKQWLAAEMFGANKLRPSGRVSACKTCQSYISTATRYKITVNQARSLRQGGHCQICGRTRKLEVDHNHVTKELRGVLCARCNRGLGQFLDDVTLLKKALFYLETANGEKLVRRGEESVQIKLSGDQIIEVQRRRSAGKTLTSIAKEFGVSIQTISNIGHNWGK